MLKRTGVMIAVVLLHGLILAAAWLARIELSRQKESAVMIALVTESSPARTESPPKLQPVRLVAPVPTGVPDTLPVIDFPAPEAPDTPVTTSHPTPPGSIQVPTEALETELAVRCPDRAAPQYPLQAKRQREQGEVRLRVELDESGRIDRVSIVSSSGFARLDEAARTAIKLWRCEPAQRDGKPVRAVAMQSLAFELERR